ncbi:MAG: putative Ig domain-containing protein [Beijerinckiaceae bacterium]|jgi:hypothetical protein
MSVSIAPRTFLAKNGNGSQTPWYPGANDTGGATDANDATDPALDPFAAAFQVVSFAQAETAAYVFFPTVSAVATATLAVSSNAAPATVSTVPATSGTAAASSSTVPSWVSTLSTASIAADMKAADVNGTVTYSGLETLLTDLDATLTSSKTSLTSAELSDLKTIAANLNNGMTTSAYLTGIMKDLADGSAENATWTGGAASSIALGNLTAGSSATQLSDLIGKWFLGTDLPSSKVMMSGVSTFSVSYSASSSPLFAASGPSMNDVNQGYLGDCYLLSSLAEVAKQNSGLISSMFTSNGNNTYGVRFYVDGVAEYVTVNTSLPDGGDVFNFGTDIWASLAEKAYAQLQTGGAVTGNTVNDGNSFSTIGNGGCPEYALEEITGASAITDFDASKSSWTTVVYNSSLQETSYSSGSSTSAVLSTLASDLSKGDDLVLSSDTSATDSSGKTTLVADHAMSIYGYDSTTGELEIRNPWGTAAGQTWDTTFEVSLTTLLSDGDTITADNVGTGSSSVTAPVLTAQTATQTWKLGQAVDFVLSSTAFTDPQAEKLTYSATLSTGAALPSWLSFNAATGTFTGTVPNTAAGLSIKVTAADTSGLSSSETFSVLTPATAPELTAQTANQSWKTNQTVNLALPASTFTDPQAEKLTYTATQASSAALPSWLKFNATTDTFSGTAPSTASSLSLKVTATDTSGLSVSETFTATIAAAASQLTQAISSIPSGSGSGNAGPVQLVSTTTPVLVSPAH